TDFSHTRIVLLIGVYSSPPGGLEKLTAEVTSAWRPLTSRWSFLRSRLRDRLAWRRLLPRDSQAALQQILQHLLLGRRHHFSKFLGPLRHQLLQPRNPLQRFGRG